MVLKPWQKGALGLAGLLGFLGLLSVKAKAEEVCVEGETKDINICDNPNSPDFGKAINTCICLKDADGKTFWACTEIAPSVGWCETRIEPICTPNQSEVLELCPDEVTSKRVRICQLPTPKGCGLVTEETKYV